MNRKQRVEKTQFDRKVPTNHNRRTKENEAKLNETGRTDDEITIKVKRRKDIDFDDKMRDSYHTHTHTMRTKARRDSKRKRRWR